ncbi:AraC family transcriptional regulator [Listeria costaricensis]|uniref:AraC family transcriptional regulator n=1 Tax=Listeria costaricensis TaxID=2026604 RepID=UPI000C087E03|nr:AraC family transcriptional regulator [Listeria costaricensis]
MLKYELVKMTDDLPVCYIVHHQGKKNVAPHWHEALEISYTKCGSIQNFYIDGQNFQTSPGDVLVINSNTIHSVIGSDLGENIALSIIFDYAFLKEMIPDYPNLHFHCYNRPQDYQKPAYQKLQSSLQNFLQLTETSQSILSKLKMRSLIFDILAVLYEHFSTRRVSDPNDNQAIDFIRLRKIIDFIEENYMKELNVTLIANHFDFSPEYFSRFFKQYVGINVKDYLLMIRLQKAYSYVVNSEEKMIDIAYLTGFPNEKSFTTAFKKSYLETPYQFRKKNKLKQ